MVYKDLWVVSFPRCTAGPNIAGSCCIRLHTTANTHATTLNIVGATMLGVVVSVCTPLPTSTQQLPPLLAQQCWELLRPFAHHCQQARNNSQHCWRNNVGSCCVRLHAALHVVSVCTPCCVLLRVVAQSLKPVKLLPTCKRTQQLPTMLSPFARGFIQTRFCKNVACYNFNQI